MKRDPHTSGSLFMEGKVTKMAKITFPEAIEKELEKLDEVGPLSREDVRTWFLFHEYSVNLLADEGLVIRGTSFKDRGWSHLLVVKVAREGIPLVGFFTERSPTTCMRAFLKMLRDGRVEWREDKFV